MMKFFWFVLFCLLISIESCYADIPITYVIFSDLIMKNGKTISGFFETSNYGGCDYSEEEKSYLVLNNNFKMVPITEKMIFNEIKNVYDYTKKPVKIYKNMYKLHYIPTKKNKINPEVNLASLATYGVLSKEYNEVYPKDIKNIIFKGCNELDIAGLLLLDNFEFEYLQKTAIAMFSIETESIVTFNLISYNKKYDSPKKIIKFLNGYLTKNNFPQFPAGQKSNNEDWLKAIYDHSENFKKICNKNRIVFLLYHVVD